MAQGEVAERIYALEKDLNRLEGRLEKLLLKLEKQDSTLRELSKEKESRDKAEAVLRAALGLGADAAVGDRGTLDDMDDSILRLEDYLLALGERVQKMLTMLQDHKELLDDVQRSVLGKGRRDRMRLELDIMMNSISILAMAGIEIDPSIPAELDELRRSVLDSKEEIEGLRRRQRELNRRLEGDIKKYDLDKLYSRRKQIPGYG